MDQDKIRAAFLEKFRQIACERLAALEDLFCLVRDTPTDQASSEKLMRELHTLKGESRMMGFADAGRILHAVEDALKLHREDDFSKLESLEDLFRESLGEVEGILVREGKPDTDRLCARLGSCMEPAADTPAEETKTEATKSTPKKTKKKPKTGPKKKAAKPKERADSESAAKPEEETAEGAPSGPRPAGGSAGPAPAAAAPTASRPKGTGGTGIDLSRYRLAKVVRVDGHKLDQLADMTGELFSSHLRMHELTTGMEALSLHARSIAASLDRTLADAPEVGGVVDEVHSLEREMARIRRLLLERTSGTSTMLDYLLDHVRQIRLLPVASLFSLYRTAARDIARGTGKQINVTLEGEGTLVDRSILDTLGDVMLHLIRNAADHGIESTEERVAAGKEPRGRLSLRARPVNDRVVIEVEDDGRGIDPDRVTRRAVERGLIAEEAAQGLDRDEVMELLFLPGFSTAEQTTETSGRGVGMDVVRSKLQDLGGAIHISSELGRGTLFALELPTSIAIARVLLFRVAGQVFGVLATFVERVEKVPVEQLLKTPSGQAVLVEEQTVAVAEASRLLRLKTPEKTHERLPLVHVEHGGRRVALAVESLIGERELTIKPFSPFLSEIRAVSGVATLEDGSLVLVLHAGEIVASAGERVGKSLLTGVQPVSRHRHRVLLVEDSLITRELERSVLQSFGLEVDEAGDGLEALQLLASGGYDMVVSDVEMPRMDGFELTRKIKADQATAHLPVILVTTLGSDEHRRQGMRAGADAYVVKTEFGSQSFLDLVRRFLP